MSSIPQNNLAYPVHITIGQSKGSGFYLNTSNATYLVTARHVLFRNGLELYNNEAQLVSFANNLSDKIILEADCRKLLDSDNLKKHPTADVAVMKISGGDDAKRFALVPGVTKSVPVPDGIGILGIGEKSTHLLEKVVISNDVVLFGYPGSLGKEGQLDRSKPLLRRGMVAGKTEDRRIVIDCPVYFGNSGGLVLEIIEQHLGQYLFRGIGLATEMIPFVEELWSRQFNAQTGIRYENSGYSLVEPMDRVHELL